MKAFVRFSLISIVLVALAFLCEGLRDNFFNGSDSSETVITSTHSLTEPGQSDHSFIKLNTACLASPTGNGHTVTRTTSTVSGASGSPCRQQRKTESEFKALEFKAFYRLVIPKPSLPALRKLRL